MKQDYAMDHTKFGDFQTGMMPMDTKVHVSLEQGKAERKEWTFTRYFFIGRRKSADVYIPDNHVSRLHAVVFIRDGKWWLQDLKSANGTIVNGKTITKHRSHPLESENQLRLSKAGPVLNLRIEKMESTKMKSTKEVPAVPNLEQIRNDKHSPTPSATLPMDDQAKRIPPKWPKIAIVTGSVVSVFIVLVMITYIHAPPQIQIPQQDTPLVDTRAGEENKEAPDINASTKTQERPDTDSEVHETPKKITTASPMSEDEGNSTETDSTKEEDLINQTIELYFNAAKKFADKRLWQPALEYYRSIAKIKPDYPDLNTEIELMQLELESQKIFEAALSLIEQGKYEEGIANFNKIAENSVYSTEIGKYIADAKARMSQEANKQKKAEVDAAQAEENKKAKKIIGQALNQYIKGNIKYSLQILDRVLDNSNKANPELKKKATQLKSKFENAQMLYRKGVEAYENDNIELTQKTWTQVVKVDRALLGRKKSSYVVKNLGQKMAAGYGALAMTAFSKGNLHTASEYSKKALKLKKDDANALSAQKKLVQKSKEIYQSGYILEQYNPRQAMEKWKLIMQICPRDAIYYKKAAEKIGKK